MVANVGYFDRSARVVVGIQMMALGLSGAVGGNPGLALIVIGSALLVTGAFGRCWLYRWLGWSTVHEDRRTGEQDRRVGSAAAPRV